MDTLSRDTHDKDPNSAKSSFGANKALLVVVILIVIGLVIYLAHKDNNSQSHMPYSNGSKTAVANQNASGYQKTNHPKAGPVDTPCATVYLPDNSNYEILAGGPCELSWKQNSQPLVGGSMVPIQDINSDKTLQDQADFTINNFKQVNNDFQVVNQQNTTVDGLDAISFEWSTSLDKGVTTITYIVQAPKNKYIYNTSNGQTNYAWGFTITASPYTKNGQAVSQTKDFIQSIKWK